MLYFIEAQGPSPPVFKPALCRLVSADEEVPGLLRHGVEALGFVDPNLSTLEFWIIHDVVTLPLEGIRRGADRGRIHKVKLAELRALGGQGPELLRVGGIRYSREIDPEELGIGLAVGRAMKHSVDVVEDVDLVRNAVRLVLP